jgi:hypothetical protein
MMVCDGMPSKQHRVSINIRDFRRSIGLCFLVIIAFTPSLAAQNGLDVDGYDLSVYEGRPRIEAVRLNPGETINLDGVLSESVWERAVPASDFIQQDPDLGEAATERTEVRIVFTENSLYIGVNCFDSQPNAIMGNTMQRDGSLTSDDRFRLTMDTYLDGRSGYLFELNPIGAMRDTLMNSGGVSNMGGAGIGGELAWDGIWDANVQRSDLGWTIEIEIPFRTVNFDPDAPAWGINFQRTLQRRNEESVWAGFARNQGVERMSNAGLLTGLSELSQGLGLDVQPYTTGAYTDSTSRGIDSLYQGDVGVDFIYNVTPQLKANFTINTDFAETEVDSRRVNLTRFPLFFSEQRDFFLDGSTFFDFSREQGSSVLPFFSRRIGLTDGQPQRIDIGAKLTGQAGAFDVGLLQVRTGENTEQVGEDFTILRTKRRIFLQSYVGGIYTRRAPRGTSAAEQTAGIDFQLRTAQFLGSDNLNFSGFYVWTTGTGLEDRAAWGFRAEYPNDIWDIRMAVRELQEHYDPAVGFVQRRGIRRYNPDIFFGPRPNDSSLIRRFGLRFDPEITTDTANRSLTRNWNIYPFEVVFQSGDSFIVRITPTDERLLQNFEISDGVVLPGGTEYSFTRYQIDARTANRRVVSVSAQYEFGTFFTGDRRDFSLDLGIRPRAGVLINLENEWNRIELGEGDFSTRVHRLNVNTQFTPRMFAVNNVQYDSVSRILGWQMRFRWILRPGNDLHFVYAQNWLDDPSGDGRITLDRSAATKLVYTHRF